jgi:hypothetical protein
MRIMIIAEFEGANQQEGQGERSGAVLACALFKYTEKAEWFILQLKLKWLR